jgi:uncharacterized protein (UPF0332 family)
MHEELLEIADELVRRETRRPRQASLKRAISTAYYALFHRLCLLCADELVGWTRPWDLVTPIYRTMDHGTAKRLFQQTRDGQLLGQAVSDIGKVFQLLQEQRHIADYDPRPLSFGRAEVIDLISQARQATDAIERLQPDTKLRLAIYLAAKHR